MSVSCSYLLQHTFNTVPSDSYHTYVKDYDGPPLSKNVNPLDDVKISDYIFVDAKKTKVFKDNPVLTDVTQAVHTDIHKILQQNPDVNGLSLILEDAAAAHNSDFVQFEDFVEPSRYRDIFDVQEFYDRAKRSFSLLPAKLRKAYNNDPAQLCSAISSKDPLAVSAISEFLGFSSSNSESKADVPLSSDDMQQNTGKKSAPLPDEDSKK